MTKIVYYKRDALTMNQKKKKYSSRLFNDFNRFSDEGSEVRRSREVYTRSDLSVSIENLSESHWLLIWEKRKDTLVPDE
jgi:hypothetical protein